MCCFPIGESIHWSPKPALSLDARPWSQPEAVDVELTAYVLLAQLSKASLTQKEIAKATAIVAWLAKQRNAYGGFSSTQVNSLLSNCHFSGTIRSCVEIRKNNNNKNNNKKPKLLPLTSRSRDLEFYREGEKHVKKIQDS